MEQPILVGCVVRLKANPSIKGVVVRTWDYGAEVMGENGRPIMAQQSAWEWTPADSPAWKPNPGDDVVIRVQEVHGDIIYTRGGGITLVSDVRPLPALSAEDAAAVLRSVYVTGPDELDHVWLHVISDSRAASFTIPAGSVRGQACLEWEASRVAALNAVRACAAAQAQAVPQDSAWQPVDPDIHAEYDDPAADAVDEADEEARRWTPRPETMAKIKEAHILSEARNKVMETALRCWIRAVRPENDMVHPWTEMYSACAALDSLLSPPAPVSVDPMEAELLRLRKALTTIRDINLGPDQASATWRVQEAASIARTALSAMEGK